MPFAGRRDDRSSRHADRQRPVCEPIAVDTHRAGGRSGRNRPLEARTATITGAGRGIGQAVAFALAEAGATVALLARTRAELDETVRRIHNAGGTALAVIADLREPAQWSAAIARIHEWRGGTDILVNNAASIGPLGSSRTLDPAEYAATLMLNVAAVVSLTLSVLPWMLDRGWGRVLNVSSGVAAHPAAMIGANAYATTKAAIEAHTLNLAAELEGTGVTVNAYRPGVVDTAMQAQLRDHDTDAACVELRDRSRRLYKDGALISAAASAHSLLARLPGEETGQIWTASDRTDIAP
jgi:NAD(P)-dependent dehydrogenase (short-subunit alcohol dehydrogenase family)